MTFASVTIAAFGFFVGPNPGTDSYLSVQLDVANAFDKGSAPELRKQFLADQDRAVFSFGVALIDFYERRLQGSIGRTAGLAPETVEATRIRIQRCIMHDPNSAYAKALYAWFVDKFREPGMAAPTRELSGTQTVILADGKTEQVPIYRVLSDEGKRKRVTTLAGEALKLDPNNQLAKYILAANDASTVSAIAGLWDSIGNPGEFLWETDALFRIKSRAESDAEALQRVQLRLEQLRSKIGGASPRLRQYGF
jgi:hypothetical protein